MLYLKRFILTLVIFFVSSYYGVCGYAISGKDLKQEPQLSPPLIAPSSSSPTTESPKGGMETKTEQTITAHHVPLDIVSGNARTHFLAKRDVNEMDDADEAKVNGMYDPNLMLISKRSAAALNKLMHALRSLPYEEPASNSFENELEASRKEVGGQSKLGSERNSRETFPSYALQRRGQKDRKIYLRCYFNAVSCF